MPALALLFFTSCKKKEVESDIYTIRQWKSDLSVNNVVPTINGRTDHAVAVCYLMTDNKLYYYLYFDTPLNNGDKPTKAVIYSGAAGANGAVLIDLNNGAYNTNREVKGSVELSAQTITDLNSKTLYLQIASSQQASGLVRGTLTSY
jgi:predicted xylose isomerase-like sugar epimerase